MAASTDGDSELIEDDDSVFRRVPAGNPSMVVPDQDTGGRRISSAAFAAKRHEDGLSVYLHSRLVELGLGLADVAIRPKTLIVELGVAEIRELPPLDVVADPWPKDAPDPEHPRNGAHALITGWRELSRNDRRELQRALAMAARIRMTVG